MTPTMLCTSCRPASSWTRRPLLLRPCCPRSGHRLWRRHSSGRIHGSRRPTRTSAPSAAVAAGCGRACCAAWLATPHSTASAATSAHGAEGRSSCCARPATTPSSDDRLKDRRLDDWRESSEQHDGAEALRNARSRHWPLPTWHENCPPKPVRVPPSPSPLPAVRELSIVF